MRKILLFTTLSILIFCTLPSDAQMVTVKEKPSFYLGKRSIVTLNLGLQPTISPMNPGTKRDKTIPIYPNLKSELTYTIALNNKVAFFAKLATNKSSRQEADDIRYIGGNVSSYIYLKEEGMPVMKGTTLGAGFSFFKRRKAAIAPIGSHFSLGLLSHKYNVTYSGMSLVSYDDYYGPVDLDISDRKSSFRYISLEMAFCTNQLITKNLYYHLGFSTSFHSRLATKLLGDKNSADSIDNQLFSANLDGLAFRDIAVLKIGLGYVLF
jgi:hypothetical protein